MKSRYKSVRSIIAVIVMVAVVLGFASRLFAIQIRDNQYYLSQNNSVKTYTIPIEAARGEIVDRNGNSLVTNRQGNSIILNAVYFPSSKENSKRNEIIYQLIKLFEQNGEEFVNNLPLEFDSKGNIRFTDDEEAVDTMKSADMLDLQHYEKKQSLVLGDYLLIFYWF